MKQAFISIALMTLGLLIIAPVAGAATITVDTTADIINSGNSDGACSLREAVISANNDVSMDTCTAGSGGDTIILGAGEYTLTINSPVPDEDASLDGDLDILNSLTIEGAGVGLTMINAGGFEVLSDRIFHIMNSASSPDITVNIKDMTLSKGCPIYDDPDEGRFLAFGAGIYVENYANLNVENVTIEGDFTYGPGGIHIDDGTASFSNIVVRDHYSDDSGGGIHINDGTVNIADSIITNNTGWQGGGIAILNGTITIDNSIINGNTGENYYGGGIYAWDGTPSIDNSFTLTINNSIISSNYSDEHGGGIYARDGEVNINKSTISENTNYFSGGGIDVEFSTLNINNSTISDHLGSAYGGGLNLISSTATIIGCTISNNKGSVAGGIYTNNSTTTIGSTIFTKNDNSDAPDCFQSGTDITSLGYNIVNSPTNHPFVGGECTFASTGDQTGVDPLLDPLADNGGPTMTHALLEGSPAIDAGNPACAGGTDQRGAPRPVDGDASGTATCDIGAYEYLSTPPAIDEPAAAVSESSMTFAALNPSGYSDSTITLTNDGTGDLVIGTVGDTDPLEAPFSIVGDECSDQSLASGETCDITVRFEPSTIAAAATGLGSLGIVMLGVVLGSGISRRRKTLALLLIGAVIAISLLTACGSSSTSDPVIASDSFNIPTNYADNPNITINVNGSY